MHQALYRKYRPSTFSEVVGQEHITRVLQYEVAQSKTCHAYLFCGSRGTGKTTCAKILAKAVNCLSPVNGDPCGKCANCLAVDNGTTDILEMDAASNTGVDYIRDIREEVRYAPSQLKGRVYIIDEVHMLTDSAFNALLKTLEEPPSGVMFILATTEMQKIPATILSRCQRFDFRRIKSDVIASRLAYIANQEGIVLESDAAHAIARIAEGGMRDAISLLELCSSGETAVNLARVSDVSGNAGNATVIKTIRAILNRDCETLFSVVAEIYNSSLDIGSFWVDLQKYYRDMLAFKATKNMPRDRFRMEILDATENEMAELAELSEAFRYETLVYHTRILEEAYINSISRGSTKRMGAEMALLRLVEKPLDSGVDALLQRIAALEDALLTGRVPSTPVVKTVHPPVAAPVVKPEQSENKRVLKALRQYPEIVRAFERSEPTCAAFLSDADAYYDGENVLIRLKNSFHLKMLENKNAPDTLSILIRNIEGIDAKVVFELETAKTENRNDLSTLFDE